MRSRSLGRREFLIGAGGLAGATASAVYLASRDRQRTVELTPLEELMRGQPLEVLIVGSGPAGSILGSELATAGITSAIIESGPITSSTEKLDAYVVSGPIDYPIFGSKVRGLGGTSSVWTGRSSRFHPIDFELNAYTPLGARWPFTYSELELYYERAERSLRVRGGPLSEYHAPRASDLPFAYSRSISDLKSLLGEVGVVVDRSPTSQASLFERGAIRAGRDILPEYSTSGFGLVTSSVVATRVVASDDGDVAGVRVRGIDGNEGLIRSDAVVLACGAIENARLLLLSQADGQIRRLGSHTGRFFMEHPHLNFDGKLDQPVASHPQLGRSMQFYDEFKNRGLGSVDLAFWTGPDNPFLRIGARIELKPSDRSGLSLTMRDTDGFGDPGAELFFAFSEEDISVMRAAKQLITGIFDDLGIVDIAEASQTWGHHQMGTCRMGANPETSVVDSNLRVHGIEGLYVLGSSAFVTAGAAHPTLLIAALAHRLADHLSATRRESLLGPE